jgi:hypothetical protein
LHVLGTPPAFVLSQDQTLKIVVVKLPFVHLKSAFWMLPSIYRSFDS